MKNLVIKYLKTYLKIRGEGNNPTVPEGVYKIIDHVEGYENMLKLVREKGYIDLDPDFVFCASASRPSRDALMPEEFCKHCKKSEFNLCWAVYTEHEGNAVYLIERENLLNEDDRTTIVWWFANDLLDKLNNVLHSKGTEELVKEIERTLGITGFITLEKTKNGKFNIKP